MTREEIIGGLQFTIDMFLLNPNTGETREDYEMNDMDKTTIDACKGAIKLLEQEPCDKCVYSTKDGYCQYDDITETIPPFEPCEDAISRQDAYKCLEIHGDYDTLNEVYERLKKSPSVKPQEPITGHWIKHPHEYGEYWQFSKYECSECHVWEDDDSDYCPNCGAKMEEGD